VDPARVAALERRLGHRFQDLALLERALTHTSYANEHPPPRHHEGLAFLGDAALALIVAERLLGEDPDAPVGVLTPRRAALVSGANLALWATELDLGPLLRLGRGEDLTGGRARESILATALEAVLGVVYLEAGLPGVAAAVGRLAAW
jgi:ribonuclease-3